MDESSPFTKRHVEEVTAARRTLLDELNLPPKVKDFLRAHARALQLAFLALVVVLVGGNYYSYYTATKNDQAAQQLTQALLLAAGEQRAASLQQITVDFAHTGSARWAQVTLASDYLGQKEYGQALGILQGLIVDVDRDNSLFPLVQQLAGVASELNGQLDEALSHYTTLSSVPGFEALGYVESGRVYELQGMAAKAKDVYEKANASTEMRPEQRAWIQEKIKTL